MADTTAACAIEACGRPTFQRGWCARHYKRAWRYGDPLAGGPFREVRTLDVCRVEWCKRAVKAKGLCGACYFYTRVYGGDPAARRPFGARTEEEVLRAVAAIPRNVNGCRDSRADFWCDDDEYARVQFGDRRETVTRMVLADALGRPIKDGHVACHTCDHPWCVERTHLWEGTHADNLRDRDLKGRTARGAAGGTAVLTDDDVREIRRLYRPWMSKTEPGNRIQLARRFGVHRSTISNIVARRSWTHI